MWRFILTAVALKPCLLTMLALHRYFLFAVAACLPVLIALYASLGQLKPYANWKWIDIIGEGGTAIMAAVWLGIICYNRPRGLVTRCFAFGFAALMLGNFADCLDEFFALPKSHLWDNILESGLNLGGMLSLTAGMYYWQEEQRSLNLHMQKRERVFRDHRSLDRVAQIANVDYLRQQIQWQATQGPACLVMLNIVGFHKINREQGLAAGDQLLQTLAQFIVLNLDSSDLLCRYAADHYVLLLPGLNNGQARDFSEKLCALIQLAEFPINPSPTAAPAANTSDTAQTARLRLSLQMNFAISEHLQQTTLSQLSRQLSESQRAA